MERIWLKSYPGGAPAEINADAFGSIGLLHGERREVPRPDRPISMGQAISFDELDRLSTAMVEEDIQLRVASYVERGVIAKIAIPENVAFAGDLPLTSADKVDKKKLRADRR